MRKIRFLAPCWTNAKRRKIEEERDGREREKTLFPHSPLLLFCLSPISPLARVQYGARAGRVRVCTYQCLPSGMGGGGGGRGGGGTRTSFEHIIFRALSAGCLEQKKCVLPCF